MNKLPSSWAVYLDFVRETHPVIKCLNEIQKFPKLKGTSKGYYGIGKQGRIEISSYKHNFDTILTEEKFLELSKETMTKQEIENYKDFKRGDILKHAEMLGRDKTFHFCKVVETLGDLIWISLLTGDVKNIINNVNSQPYFRQNLYNANYRLYIPEEKIQEETLELTLEDIAAKYGKKVEEIKIKK